MTPTVLSFLAEAAWFVLLGLTMLATLPPGLLADRPDPAIPPGAQALLAHRVQPGWLPSGVDATFADLARRGWFELTGHEVRLGEGDGRTLNPAETEVLDHVRAVLARSGQQAAPLPALQEGPGSADRWRRFREAYQTWAEEQGLIKRRFGDKLMILLILTGGAAGAWFVGWQGVTNVWALLGIFVGFCIVHGMLVFKVDKLVLTPAGAAAAGPVATAVPGPHLAGQRSNTSGWTYSQDTGWRQWRLGSTSPALTFSPWPGVVLAVALVGWSVVLASVLVDLGPAIAPSTAIQVSAVFYPLVIAVYIALRISRRTIADQHEREFRKVNVPVTGQVVRAYQERRSGEDNTPDIEYFVVLDPGPDRPARLFQVSEEEYESVQEGHSTVRALPRWRSIGVDRFEVLP